jgi:hypothetical protein
LTGKFKGLCDQNKDKTTYQELDNEGKNIFDEFIKIGCRTLICLYNNFEKKLKIPLKSLITK